MKKLDPSLVAGIVVMLMLAVVAFTLLPSLAGFINRDNERQVQSITDTINKTLVQCYALEGTYPPDLEYLAKHYGLILDEEKYFYQYSVVAANVPPDVWVAKR